MRTALAGGAGRAAKNHPQCTRRGRPLQCTRGIDSTPMARFLSLLILLVHVCIGCAGALVDVFLVPHSHCDPGWLLSAQQYFDEWPKADFDHRGSNCLVSGGSVRQALDHIVAELTLQPDLRFVWSETIWLDKWWRLQNATTRAALRALVAAGQLEIVGGGYVQPCEATTSFRDIIDQATTGHEALRAMGLLDAGVRPRVGYQIDMFAGYSSVAPSLWKLAGFDAMVIRYQGNATLKEQWTANQVRDLFLLLFWFVWLSSPCA